MSWQPKVTVRFVDPNGCYFWQGIRVRGASGHGKGSLSDEAVQNIITPLDSEETRKALCRARADIAAFVLALPVVRIIPCGT